MGIREIISGATNADGKYDDVYLPKKAGIWGSPGVDPAAVTLAAIAGTLLAGATVFRLWRARGPGARKLRRERETD